MNNVVLFLIFAILISTASFVLLGVLLLPALGVEGMTRTMIAGGVSGGAIAILYVTMLRKSDRA